MNSLSDSVLIKFAIASDSKSRGNSGLFNSGFVPNTPATAKSNTATVPPPAAPKADPVKVHPTVQAPAAVAAQAVPIISKPSGVTTASETPVTPDSSEVDLLWANAMRRIGRPKVGLSGRIKRSTVQASLSDAQKKTTPPSAAPAKPAGADVTATTGLQHPLAPLRNFAPGNPYVANTLNYSATTNPSYQQAPIQGMPAENWDTGRMNPVLKAITNMGYNYATPAYNPAQGGLSPFGTQVTSFADPIYSGMARETSRALADYRPVFSDPQFSGGQGLAQLLMEITQQRGAAPQLPAQ